LTSSCSAVCVLDSIHPVFCQFIRSYPIRGTSGPDCTILQAACATIASPEAYNPVAVGEEEKQSLYVDAMSGYASPTNEMLKEAEKVFGKNMVVANVVSIGSGKPELRQQKLGPSESQLSDLLKRAITDTERVHNDIQNRLQSLGIYFRFNVENILPMVNSIGQTTRVHTTAYLEEATTSQKMDVAVTSIQERKGIKSLRELSTMSSYIMAMS
jgi:hypothetical protein